jgi:hypothetical protein
MGRKVFNGAIVCNFSFLIQLHESKIPQKNVKCNTERAPSSAERKKQVVPKGMQSTTKLQKVVPKGAQRKFSARKSFLRECRAKYRRNIRRRSSKVVHKGMQNLHRKVNGDTTEIEGEEVQKTFLRECRTYTENKRCSRKINGKEISAIPKGMKSFDVAS